MTKLTALHPQQHQHLKIDPTCQVTMAARQHMFNIRVTEVAKSIASMPVFISRNEHNGEYALSAICSFTPGHNLFVSDQHFNALYMPLSLRTYPLYLMKAEDQEKQYTIGLVESADAWTQGEGVALFEQSGEPSIALKERQTLLESSIKEDIQTYQFVNKLKELKLIKAVDLVVHYKDNGPQVLRGLNTIDEDVLQKLSPEQLTELNTLGYLAPIYSMLTSIYQLNALVRRNNEQGLEAIEQVKLEVARDRTLA